MIIPEGIRAIYSTCHAAEEEHGHKTANASEHHHHDSGSASKETMIGLTLILGFIFMLIIDQVTHALQHSGGQGAAGASGAAATGHGSAKFFFLDKFRRPSGSCLCC